MELLRYVTIFDIESEWEALGCTINPKKFIDEYIGNARTFSHQTEIISCFLYDLERNSNPNEKGHDAKNIFTSTLSPRGELRVEIRCMGKNGINLLPSGMKGSGRTYNPEEYEDLLNNCLTHYIVVDITSFPNLYITPIRASQVLNFKQKGIMKFGASYNTPVHTFYSLFFNKNRDEIGFKERKITKKMNEEEKKEMKKAIDNIDNYNYHRNMKKGKLGDIDCFNNNHLEEIFTL